MQRKRVAIYVCKPDLSYTVTLETLWREVVKIIALPPASELTLPSDNSKHNCTGVKVDPHS